ncbi:creatinase-like [Homarus americanus]|uniref:creatinase-like n=1 Tax=Homarus americanus TaxID=6706 RepID=UPI001C4941DA|nr:creatinase-like [Homarus americanus]
MAMSHVRASCDIERPGHRCDLCPACKHLASSNKSFTQRRCLLMSSWAVGRSVWAAGRSLWAAKQSAGTKGPGVWAAGWPVCAPGSRRASNDVTSFRETKTLRMYNGQKVSPGLFSQKEVEGRITRLRQHMEGEGLAACLFTSIHNITYYTGGFVYCAFGRPYGLLVTPEKHVTISALVDGGQPWRRSPHDNIVYTDWQRKLLQSSGGGVG